jgi:hypothetical protein
VPLLLLGSPFFQLFFSCSPPCQPGWPASLCTHNGLWLHSRMTVLSKRTIVVLQVQLHVVDEDSCINKCTYYCCSGLPDGVCSNQISLFGYIHLIYFVDLWYNLWPFGIFCPVLVSWMYIAKYGKPAAAYLPHRHLTALILNNRIRVYYSIFT